MELSSMSQRAHRITWFVTVQLIALIGWIIVQSLFTLSPLSRSLSFPVTITIETIWWIATLVIMFVLFRRVYGDFVRSVLDLEEANRSLRRSTSSFLQGIKEPAAQEQPEQQEEEASEQQERES